MGAGGKDGTISHVFGAVNRLRERRRRTRKPVEKGVIPPRDFHKFAADAMNGPLAKGAGWPARDRRSGSTVGRR